MNNSNLLIQFLETPLTDDFLDKSDAYKKQINQEASESVLPIWILFETYGQSYALRGDMDTSASFCYFQRISRIF